MALIYTDVGWVTEDFPMTPLKAKHRIDSNGEMRYDLVQIDTMLPRLLFTSEPAIKILPSANDIGSIIYALSLGQRKTTPTTGNSFMDRHDKTFLKQNTRLFPEMSQEFITNFSAMSNYIRITSWSEEIGSVVNINEEYEAILASLGLLLYSLKDMESNRACDTILPNKCGTTIVMLQLCDNQIESLRMCINTPEDAIAIVEGSLICGFVRDHTITTKDKNSLRVKNAIEPFKNDISNVPSSSDGFFMIETLDILKRIAYNISNLWIISPNNSSRIDIMRYELSHDIIFPTMAMGTQKHVFVASENKAI